MILAGDIGGTNTRLGLCRKSGAVIEIVAQEQFASADFASLGAIVKKFLDAHPSSPERACFGVAGRVSEGQAKLSNLVWTVDASEVQTIIPQIVLINDLEANAYGLSELSEQDFAILNQGEPEAAGNAAIISAGTGLGEAGLHFEEGCGGKLRPFATEGGHADFAPRNELEIDLLRYLLAKFGRASFERVLSGNGLCNIYDFLRVSGRAAEPPALADELRQAADVAAVISQHGLGGTTAICVQALEMFVSIYGEAAGNLALKMLATHGVYLGGGIAPKILPKLQEPIFMQSFVEKGRMRELLEKIPVRVVLNEQTALLGAAHYACYEMHA